MVTRSLAWISALTALLIASCATFPDPSGEYAGRWTATDNAQLLALIHGRPDIERTIRDIELIRPDQAHISTTKGNGSGVFVGTDFTIKKKQGRWIIVEPVQRGTVVFGS